MLLSLPVEKSITDARINIRNQLEKSSKCLVVIDDDPTGTQTVYGVTLYTDWSVEQLRQAIKSGEPVFYISTNSRSLNKEQAKKLNYQLACNLSMASRMENKEIILASRSDSTLRGHFPYEVETLMSGLNKKFDGIILAYALFEGGRYTINDVQWVSQGEVLVSAEQTEFAKDPDFSYKHGNLKLWIEEKTGGLIKADDVCSISIEMIREEGPDAICEKLTQVSKGTVVIVNAACYHDLEIFVLGLLEAESRGKRFIYRCAASFVKVRGGFLDKGFLNYEELKGKESAGLIIVGSYVDKTTQQLNYLFQSGIATGIEIQTNNLLNSNTHDAEIQRISNEANNKLTEGKLVAIYTSRLRVSCKEDDFLNIGRTIMSSLCEIVKKIKIKPGFLITKGGITSIEIARLGLNANHAFVLGQVANCVPVWRLGSESKWPGIPYVVFPGNVGDDKTLYEVAITLKNKRSG